MQVEALRSAGGAKPRNEVTKGSSKGYIEPILLLLFATEGRDPSTPLRSAQDDTGWACSVDYPTRTVEVTKWQNGSELH